MKYIIFCLLIITFVVCDRKKSILNPLSVDEVFPELKKKLLECISQSENASDNLKNYANENLKSGLKEPLNFSTFKLVETDRVIIRKCRREALINKKKAAPKLPIANDAVFK